MIQLNSMSNPDRREQVFLKTLITNSYYIRGPLHEYSFRVPARDLADGSIFSPIWGFASDRCGKSSPAPQFFTTIAHAPEVHKLFRRPITDALIGDFADDIVVLDPFTHHLFTTWPVQ
jgi:hypothetical protein